MVTGKGQMTLMPVTVETVHRLSASSITLGSVEIYSPTLTVYEKLPDEHPFYAVVGRIASEWAHLEHQLDLVIWKLVGISSEIASCVTGQIMAASTFVFEAIAALAAAKSISSRVSKIEKLGLSVSNLAKSRNRFVHDAWYGGTTTPSRNS